MSLVNVTTGMTVFILALLSDMHRYFLGEYHDRGGCVRDVLFAILWCGLLFSYSHYCFFVCFIFVSVMKVGCVCVGGGGECPPASCQTCVLMTAMSIRKGQ